MKKAIMLLCILISVKAFSQFGGVDARGRASDFKIITDSGFLPIVQCHGDSITIPANIKFLVIDGQVYEIKRTVKVEVVPPPLPRGLLFLQGGSGTLTLPTSAVGTSALLQNTTGTNNIELGPHEMPKNSSHAN